MPNPGDTIPFSVTFNPAIDESRLTFQWTTSAGEVVEGQGKNVIGVKVSPDAQSITATVNISGLPKGCVSTASENIGCGLTPPAAARAAPGNLFEANGKARPTKIIRVEVDGKEVRKNYSVSFRLNERWIESEKTSKGFIVPTQFRENEYLSVLITFGKYKLEFLDIHFSKFTEDWVVGIDNRPFSEENAYLVETPEIKRVYYINFVGGAALETRRVVMNQ